MKRLTTSIIALALSSGTASMAQVEHDMDTEIGAYSGVVDNELSDRFIRAENIIGADIHTQYADFDEDVWDETEYYDTVDTDWEHIGSVEDIVISRDGTIVGVIAEVGGWLDIGDSHVVIDMSDLKTIGTEDYTYGDLSFVTPLSEEQLERRQDVESGWW